MRGPFFVSWFLLANINYIIPCASVAAASKGDGTLVLPKVERFDSQQLLYAPPEDALPEGADESASDASSEVSPQQKRRKLRNEEHEQVAEQQEEQMKDRYEASNVANAVAIMLLGMLTFQISLFYMVNYPDEEIRHFTWACLNTTISIFCAVPIWSAVKQILMGSISKMTGEAYDAEGLPKNAVDVFLPLMEFSAMFCIVHALLLATRHRESWFAALSTLGAHILGFAAIDGFGCVQQASPWRNSWVLSLCVTLFSALAISVACYGVTNVLQRQVANGDEEGEEWLEECNECGNEFVGFVIGQLISQTVRFVIDGSLEPIEGFPWGKTWVQVGQLGGASVFFAALLIFGTVVAQDLKRLDLHGQLVHLSARVVEMVEEILAMSFGWCLLFSGRWLFWVSTGEKGVGEGDVMTARMVQAMVFSFFVFASIFAVDCVSRGGFFDRHALRQLMRAFGLVLGLSWEGAFDEATAALGRNFEDSPRQKRALTDSLGVMVCVIVLPAWGMYVLPTARLHKQKAKKVFLNMLRGIPFLVPKSAAM